MSSDRAQVELLQAELKLVEKALPASSAAKNLRDYMDQHYTDDQLVGAPGANPWLQAPQKGGCEIL